MKNLVVVLAALSMAVGCAHVNPDTYKVAGSTYSRDDGLFTDSSNNLHLISNGSSVANFSTTGALTASGGLATPAAVSFTQGVAFNDMRVHDNLAALLPVAAAADDAGNVPGTVGTTAPSLQSVDFGATTADEKATFSFVVPEAYIAGGTINVVANAGMLTTVSDGTATLDFECWAPDYANADGTVSADLIGTAAQSINSLTFADFTYVLDDDASGHDLAAGDLIQCRMSFAGSDTGDAGAGITGVVRKLHVLVSS